MNCFNVLGKEINNNFFNVFGKVLEFHNENNIVNYLVETDFYSEDFKEFFTNFKNRQILENKKEFENISTREEFLQKMFEIKAIEKVIPVYVYGSLRKGMGNHHYVKESLFSHKTIISGFDMFSLRAYPYISHGEGNIVAELYFVTEEEFKSLDCLEGYPDFYNRELVKDKNGFSGWIYFIDNRDDKVKTRVVDGDWVKFKRSNVLYI